MAERKTSRTAFSLPWDEFVTNFYKNTLDSFGRQIADLFSGFTEAPPASTPPMPPKSSVSKDERLQSLEKVIRAQRAHLSRLEECRRYEHATEKMLAKALTDIAEKPYAAKDLANQALREYVVRLGPRPPD